MKKAHILLCDDEIRVRNVLKMILEEAYDLSFAGNGKEAVQFLKKNNPDLVILDIKMPRLGGIEALRNIKQVKPNLPVLMLTGYESYDVAQEAADAGADDYLTKPVKRKDLHAHVEALLNRKL